MKTRSHIVALAIAALALSPHLARGQSLLIPEQILRIKAANLVCNANTEGKMYRVVDASSLGDCDTTGGGTVSALCLCDNLSFVPIAVDTDLAASYVPVTKNGQQSVSATGAGNDVTVNAADDVILVPTDALTVTPGGAAAITTTAGAITLTAGGTTQDISLVSVDDVILTPTGSLTATAADGTIGVTTTFAVDAAGGADEFGVGDGFLGLVGCNFLGAAANTTGKTCDAGAECDSFWDTTAHAICYCNGTAWKIGTDGTTGCTAP